MIQIMSILCPEIQERVYFNVQGLQLLFTCKKTTSMVTYKKDCSDELEIVMPAGCKSIRKFQRQGISSFMFNLSKNILYFAGELPKMLFRNAVVLNASTHIHIIGFLTLQLLLLVVSLTI